MQAPRRVFTLVLDVPPGDVYTKHDLRDALRRLAGFADVDEDSNDVIRYRGETVGRWDVKART